MQTFIPVVRHFSVEIGQAADAERTGSQIDWDAVDPLTLKAMAAADKVGRNRHELLSTVKLANVRVGLNKR
jgi:hypothetical protein